MHTGSSQGAPPPAGGWMNLVLFMGALAAGSPQAAAADPLFESLEPLPVRLTAPLRDIARDRDESPEERPATFEYQAPDGTWRAFEIGLEPRGHSRRDREVCQFPPLRLNFRRKDVEDTLLAGQNKLKVVTHCRRSSRHDQYVFKEYLAYRLLGALTESAFRVRLMDVEYVDLARGGRSERRFGFVIEDVDRLAERLGFEPAEPGRIRPAELAADHTSLMALYQFMIGNTDFSFIAPPVDDHCCHNVKLLKDSDGRYWPMPYDFDISGFVDPPYAVVDAQLSIPNVRTRMYRGFCWDRAVLDRAASRFLEARPRLLEVLRRETPLDDRTRRRSLDYLEQFFVVLNDPQALERKVLGECRGRVANDES